jgi:hypothetical protein
MLTYADRDDMDLDGPSSYDFTAKWTDITRVLT